MKRSIALVLAVAALAARASADPEPAKKEAASRIPFAATSDTARASVNEALALGDAMAPNPVLRAAAEKAVAADGELAIAHYLLGLTYFGDEAKPYMDKATALAAKAPEGERLYIEAALLQRARKSDEATVAFKNLQAKWPGEPLVRLSLAELYQGAGQFDSAREAAEAAVKLSPDSARAHTLLGGALLSQEQYGRARSEFEVARKHLAPGVAPGNVWFGIATSYVYEGQTKPAIETLRSFVDSYRKAGAGSTFPEVFIWNAMARIQLESGDPKSAIDTYAKGFESIKGSDLSVHDKTVWEGRLHHGRGRSLARMGKAKEAWAEAEIVKKMIDAGGEEGKEFVPSYHYLAGYLKLEAGEIPEAIEHLKQAQANDDPFRALLLARAYEKAGQKENARAEYQKIVATRRNSLERALAYPEAKKKLS
jgi:tetratricopeptide (TPR) repeat protein